MATIVVTGRCGKDGELKTLQNGDKVLQFSLADDIGWGDKKTTQWIQCAYFGKRAEAVAQYVTKGAVVEISGVPQVEAWIKRGTQDPQAAIKVRVNELKLHGGKKDERGETETYDGGRRQPSRHQDDDADIPF